MQKCAQCRDLFMKSSNADTSVIYTPKGGLERGSQSESEISNDGRKNYFL